jgi:hypothetical protein
MGEGIIHPDLKGKRKENLRIVGKENFQVQCTRGYWSSLLSRSILPEAVLEHWKQGVTSTLGPWQL